MPTPAEIGAAGEAFVAGRLARQGYHVLTRNWHARHGELDIVALDGDCLVFVEVRVRTGDRIVSADASLTAEKRRALIASAGLFVARHPEHHDRVWRLDLVAITLTPAGSVAAYRHHQNVSADWA